VASGPGRGGVPGVRGIRQLLTLERFIATFQIGRKQGQWGNMSRLGIGPAVESREHTKVSALP
jgi:hypothetical protein